MKRTVVVIVTIMVVVWSVSGAAGGTSADNESPLADAGLDQEVEVGAWVLLDGGGSRDPDGEIVGYEWEIAAPDGTTMGPECSTCERTRFQATQVGVYEVTLSVTDDDGASSADTLYVTVADSGDGPSVALSGPSSLSVDETGTFAADLDDGSARIERIRWQVDGETVANRSVSPETSMARLDRSFSTVGERDVSVTVVDAEGRTASDALSVEVQSTDPGDPPGPIPDPMPGPLPSPGEPGDGGLTVTIEGPDEVERNESEAFEAVVEGADGEIAGYDWFRVDGNDGRIAHRTFDESAGTEVTLAVIVRTTDGEVASTTKEVEVVDGPPEIFIEGPRFVEQGEEATFEAVVLGERHPTVSYSWEPADGTFDSRKPGYSREFDEEVGETINVTATVQSPTWSVEETRMVRVKETHGEPNESRAEPQVTLLDPTREPREGSDDEHYWAFEAEVLYWGDGDVTAEWEFADGTRKFTTHEGLNGTTDSTVDVFFTYDPADDPHDRRDGPRTRGMPVTVTVTDETGDADTASDTFVVTEYPREDSGLDVTVSPSQRIRAGTGATFAISPVTSGEIAFGDGETARFGTDPADPTDETAEVSHTYDRAGNYTVAVTTDDGRYEEVVVEATEATYEVYKYEKNDWETEETKARNEPRGDGWEIVDVDEVKWDYTDTTRSFESGKTPSRIVESKNWRHVRTETRTEEETYSMTATESPGPEWTLVEENVDQEQKRVEYTLPDGSTAWGWETVYYHRYERTVTTDVAYKVWRYAERTVIYNWERDVYTRAIKYSLTKPGDGDYIPDSIEIKTFSCGNKDAPKYKEACLPEYDPPEQPPDGPGPT